MDFFWGGWNFSKSVSVGSTFIREMRFAQLFNINNQIFSIKGRFVWLSGKPFNYTSWQAGEPNIDRSQECAGIHTTRRLGSNRIIFDWNDELCSNTQWKTYRYKPLCKKENGILLPKLFWPIVRKKCSSHREKLLKFEAEGREFAKFLRSLEQFIQTVKGQNNFW